MLADPQHNLLSFAETRQIWALQWVNRPGVAPARLARRTDSKPLSRRFGDHERLFCLTRLGQVKAREAP
jgi:hypothetical protein